MNFDPSKLTVSSDPKTFDIAAIHRFLSEESHWARGISRATVERSIAHSLAFAAFAGAEQVAFARVVSDRATFAFLCDVFVVSALRGRGVARRLLDAVFAHPDLQGLRRFALTSREAAGLYEGYGFTTLTSSQIWRERHNPGIYLQGK
jgi:GNAT superfamily N-acetyltransferase